MYFVEKFFAFICRLRTMYQKKAKDMEKAYTMALDSLFKASWRTRYETGRTVLPRTMVILCMVIQDPSIDPRAIAHLLKLDWKGFRLGVFVLLPYMTFDNKVKFTSKAFEEYIKDPSRSGYYYPLTPDVHADLVIYCAEYLKDYHSLGETPAINPALDAEDTLRDINALRR